jgi:hypothetical protein
MLGAALIRTAARGARNDEGPVAFGPSVSIDSRQIAGAHK